MSEQGKDEKGKDEKGGKPASGGGTEGEGAAGKGAGQATESKGSESKAAAGKKTEAAGKKTEAAGKKTGKKTEAAGKGPSRVRRIGIAALVVIGLLAVSFLAGWLKGRGALTQWRDRAQSAERLSTIYRTRHELDVAWHAIDRDNFGEARTHVGEAAKVLTKGSGDHDDLRELAKELADVQIVVSADSDAQQEKLVGYMERLDGLAAPSGTGGADEGP